ncbi:uncharacterized protein LOC123292151 [Chrysoperla carnea]|uniref:uncharacterized protein LOC123292151 n=1 Tax=Chrysoperla carnea TaxID=189513 RepID=UPI001D09980C|nr:uncharacterized protein LOC123292151 [Chrysoperla carnea]
MSKCLLHIFIVFSIVLKNQKVLGNIGDNDSEDCKIDGIAKNGYYYNRIINDTFRGNLKTFKVENVLSVRVKSNKYLGAVLNNDITKLTIFTKRAMRMYDRNEISNTTTLIINFYCRNNMSRTVVFNQRIQDINTYKPRFSQKRYVFDLQMPWPKLMDLTLLQNIVVTDLDFSNRHIQFDIVPNNYFTIELKSKNLMEKTYEADEPDAFGNQHIKERATIVIIPVFEEDIRYFTTVNYSNQRTERIYYNNDYDITSITSSGMRYYEG